MRGRLVPVGIAAVLAFGLSACSGGDGNGGDGPEASPTSPATVAAPTGPVAGADTPEGQAFCDEAALTLGELFAISAQAHEDFFTAEVDTDEWFLAFDATMRTSVDAYLATVDLAASAPTPELKAVLDDIAAQIRIKEDGSAERILDSETVSELLGQLDAACGR